MPRHSPAQAETGGAGMATPIRLVMLRSGRVTTVSERGTGNRPEANVG